MTLCIIGACLAFIVLFCCLCQKLRQAMYIRHKTNDNLDLTYENSNGKTSHSHPIRPYRSKDYLISSEPSTLHRPNPMLKSLYSNDDDFQSNRRSLFKETDLDRYAGTVKPSANNRNRSSTSTTNDSDLVSIQRRPSFQAATKFSTLDFYTTSEPFYFLDKQLTKSSQRNHYSPYANRHSTGLIMENQMIKNSHEKTNGKLTPKIEDGIFV